MQGNECISINKILPMCFCRCSPAQLLQGFATRSSRTPSQQPRALRSPHAPAQRLPGTCPGHAPAPPPLLGAASRARCTERSPGPARPHRGPAPPPAGTPGLSAGRRSGRPQCFANTAQRSPAPHTAAGGRRGGAAGSQGRGEAGPERLPRAAQLRQAPAPRGGRRPALGEAAAGTTLRRGVGERRSRRRGRLPQRWPPRAPARLTDFETLHQVTENGSLNVPEDAFNKPT
ncbi:translation initiation factor IF-2-like [Falco naumanni]|uniref:translation initiation factor IF-2-like n=1 Tax=Falco naumanni TaxID=148594 RepID=UPI001ADE31F5|nr:translation initiation factor IF-2-like [Falco naumanni]